MPSAYGIKSFVQLTRPQNASGSVFTYAIGYFLVTNTIDTNFFVGLVILLALHSYATLQNDIEDIDIDKANGRKGALLNHSVSISNTKFLVQSLAFMALVLALLSQHRKLHLTAILVLVLLAWLYNLTPVRASRKPISSIVVMGLCYGALPFMYGYLIANGSFGSDGFLLLAFFWFLARISTSIMKDYKDARGDRLLNKKTFYLRYGADVTAWTSLTTAIVAYVGIIIMLAILRTKSEGLLIALTLVSLLALRNIGIRLSLIKIKDEKQLDKIFHRSVFSHNQFEIAVLLCLIISSK